MLAKIKHAIGVNKAICLLLRYRDIHIVRIKPATYALRDVTIKKQLESRIMHAIAQLILTVQDKFF